MKRSLEATAGIGVGIAAPLVYVAAVIAGGWLTPGYSHLRQTISELTIAGAPAAGTLGNVFIAYNLLLACFAITLPLTMPELRWQAVRAAVAALLAVAVAGIGMSGFFPLTGPSPADVPIPHIALAALASLATMAAILAIAVAAWRVPHWHWLALASLACLAVVLCSGLWAALSIGSALAGLAERITIGTFMVWVLLFASALALTRSPMTDAP